MPTLEWIGKSKVINHHLDVPYRVLEEKFYELNREVEVEIMQLPKDYMSCKAVNGEENGRYIR